MLGTGVIGGFIPLDVGRVGDEVVSVVLHCIEHISLCRRGHSVGHGDDLGGVPLVKQALALAAGLDAA